MLIRFGILAAVGLAALTASAANAAVIVNISQVGGNVLVDTAGSVDLRGLTQQYASIGLDTSISGSYGYVSGGAGGSVQGFSGFSGPTSFGTGGFVNASTSTGMNFAFNAFAFGSPYVFVPLAYISGSAITASQTYNGQTFASLGLTTGSYVYTSSSDKVTVNIGQATAAVPEPASWALMLVGFGAIGYAMRRRSVAVRYA